MSWLQILWTFQPQNQHGVALGTTVAHHSDVSGADRLRRLTQQREQGILTRAEYLAEVDKLLP